MFDEIQFSFFSVGGTDRVGSRVVLKTLRSTICGWASRIPHCKKRVLFYLFCRSSGVSGCCVGQKRFLMTGNLIVYQPEHLLADADHKHVQSSSLELESN